MATLTVPDLPEDARRTLEQRADRNGRSIEDEARAILLQAIRPAPARRVGDELAAIGRSCGLTDADVEAMQTASAKRPVAPIRFE
ncbi:hypothetical protein ABB55_05970 [Prosthecomicrobium hirschii]|uniref:Antitoxin FitA-like ribbon-helix-helix domain-containing protein n=1 Tax=Prosthecodimorpha hirschii TaxID=665126 RepID=A0A0P6VKX8_9HYPH|nr:TraY domain-containing protein [Prosthecomicrobium hirschii]KPL51832.1 hypothetical protein ABB55_05970 [Prosthecomicrobium hirschii]